MSLKHEGVYEDLVNAVLTFDSDKLIDTTRKALTLGEDPVKIVEQGLAKALKIAGKKFEDGEFFLMDLVSVAEPVQRVMKDLLEPEITRRKTHREILGKIVLGTVAGDIHDIGKNIVGAMLFAAGFDVYDVGKDVPTEEFVSKCKELNANIVGASALLTTTLPIQEDIVKAIVAAGLRNKVRLMFGGAPVTEGWIKQIGADSYAEDAVEAVRVAKTLVSLEGH
jgi:corrinoid protein of di/trimethylamine methyltransferase